ncbi:MAG TPA: hypothetical protein VGK73_33330 [Polyangiaceae bacterium]
MKRFTLAQRVLVRRCGHDGEHALVPPANGVVRRLRREDDGAWAG